MVPAEHTEGTFGLVNHRSQNVLGRPKAMVPRLLQDVARCAIVAARCCHGIGAARHIPFLRHVDCGFLPARTHARGREREESA